MQIPWEAAGQSQVSVAINNGLATSAAVNVTLSAAQPGIFLLDGVNGAIEHVSGVVVSAAAPAAKGEAVVVFCTGLGPVSPAVADGVAAPISPLSYTSAQPTVTVGGQQATVLFSGLAPGFVGLNQLNVQLPANVASGSQDLIVAVGTAASNTAKIQIQ